ncbi:hypothetical protein I4U23_017747 [Adineta vaga]|nr:hypothetical protein I4U23_017747 [Adineta vaga]
MLIKLFNSRSSSLMLFVIRSKSIQSDYDLGMKMKHFNDNKQFRKVLELFDLHMKNNTKTSSTLIITQALKACTYLEDFQRGQAIHSLISSPIKHDPSILTSLIHFYMQCDDLKHAQSLFNNIKEKTLSIYGAMIKGYIENNQLSEAINLFNQIKNPSEVNVIVLFNACARLRTKEALDLVKKVSKEIPNNFYLNSRLVNTLLDALIKCGDCSSAEILFSKTKKTVINYRNLMNGFNNVNNPSKTLDLFNQMKKDRIQENIIYFIYVEKTFLSHTFSKDTIIYN